MKPVARRLRPAQAPRQHRIDPVQRAGCHPVICSMTASVIRLIVSRADRGAVDVGGVRRDLPVVSPLAVNDNTTWSRPSKRRWRLRTIPGSVRTVLARVPLREFPWLRPAGSCLS